MFPSLQYNDLGLLIAAILICTTWVIFRSFGNSWTSGYRWTPGPVVLELIIVVFAFFRISRNAVL
jgi:hypothetical protein